MNRDQGNIFTMMNGFHLTCFRTAIAGNSPVYEKIYSAWLRVPAKPVIDGEPIYEDHPVCFNVKDLGTSNAYDIRQYAYLDLFSGAFGHTYGCHDIWQFYSTEHEPINGPHVFWPEAMELPGANQMKYVRKLMESHPVTERVPDQTLILENNLPAPVRIQATRGADYVFIYSAAGNPFTVVLGKIKAEKLNVYWFDPRNGTIKREKQISNNGRKLFIPPGSGYGQDWVLILDDASRYNPLF